MNKNHPREIENVVDFKGLRITLASPETIESWSYGEVLKPETINYRTLKPEKDGLFSESIFGPTKDWECYCGKYKRIRYRGIICDKCGVEVTQSRVRRERMGHIALASPVAHVWFFKGTPSRISLLLDITPRNLEGVIYFAQYLVTKIDKEAKQTVLKNLVSLEEKNKKELQENGKKIIQQIEDDFSGEKKDIRKRVKNRESCEIVIAESVLKEKQKIQAAREEMAIEEAKIEETFRELKSLIKNVNVASILPEEDYLRLGDHQCDNFFRVEMGGEALLTILKELDLNELSASLRKEINENVGQRRLKAIKRSKIVEGLRKAGLRPEWMVLKILPVIPPDLRPMVQLSGGRFATSDLNDLYRRVINRNNRLKHLHNLGAPEIILRNERRMLQEAVDALIDSSQRSGNRPSIIRQPLRSLSDMLRGKQGRFRQNLLGKRVDYSGRSVIVVGPELKLHQCGLPKEMALEMFKPFVLRELIFRGLAPNVKSAKHLLERRPPEVFDILEEITQNHPIILNRAPTLHKLGMQAFYPVLIEGGAIRIHPCVCSGYNADFDGDQMAVHVPLSNLSRDEAKTLMMPVNNLLKPADGSPITIPNKEMALGCYYFTSQDPTFIDKRPTRFSSPAEAIFAYQTKTIKLRQPITVFLNGKLTETTAGRIIFNEALPAEMQFLNEPIKAATIKSIVIKAINNYPNERVTRLIDDIKEIGFGGATISGISMAVSDCEMIPEKNKFIKGASEKAAQIEKNYQRGLITKEEQSRLTNTVWIETTDKIADITWDNFRADNPVRIIIESGGTRASKDQVKQLAAMRGLVVDPLGKIVELPTKSNFREGLSIFEYVTSARGSRKGLTDSALKTAEAGYLTRRLIDVSHDAIIRIANCKTKKGVEIFSDPKRTVAFSSRIIGRLAAKKIVDPKTKKKIVDEGQEINEEIALSIEKSGIVSVFVRSPLTCEAKHGLCAVCYGRDLGTKKMVEIGMPVGIIAAQSIGEPGTQLTMRVKHAGGIIGLDVTQGLPRIEELFETRIPKTRAPISEINGKVAEIKEQADGFMIKIKTIGVRPFEEREYLVPLTLEIKVKEGGLVAVGDPLASGNLDVREILEINGLMAAQQYLINEVQRVYESQGIPINDKHFEVIIRKMSEKIRVDSEGDTAFLPGELINRVLFEEGNAKALAAGGEPALASMVILGITRASLYTQSWLSAASFQDTTNRLAEAATEGRIDRLLGLKENIIIGRLIPTSPERAVIE